MSVSFTLLNVSAALSARSLIWSAICVRRSKSPFCSSDRNWPIRLSRSSATFSTSFSDATCSSFSRYSQQASERAEVEVQVLVAQSELGLQLVHALGELHERLPQAFDLVIGERPALHPMQCLALHQLPQQLDQRQDELRKAAFDRFGIGRDAPGERPRPCDNLSLSRQDARHRSPAKLAGAHGPVQTRLSSGCADAYVSTLRANSSTRSRSTR